MFVVLIRTGWWWKVEGGRWKVEGGTFEHTQQVSSTQNSQIHVPLGKGWQSSFTRGNSLSPPHVSASPMAQSASLGG